MTNEKNNTFFQIAQSLRVQPRHILISFDVECAVSLEIMMRLLSHGSFEPLDKRSRKSSLLSLQEQEHVPYTVWSLSL